MTQNNSEKPGKLEEILNYGTSGFIIGLVAGTMESYGHPTSGLAAIGMYSLIAMKHTNDVTDEFKELTHVALLSGSGYIVGYNLAKGISYAMK